MAILFGYLSLVAPFVFVYSFLSAIKEILHDGEKDLQQAGARIAHPREILSFLKNRK